MAASRILAEGALPNNDAARVFHRPSPNKTCVFHTIHNFRIFSSEAYGKRGGNERGCGESARNPV